MMRNERTSEGWILTCLLGGVFLANVDVSIVNVAMPAIHHFLRASTAELQLAASGYSLSYAALLILGARLGDLHGF